MYWVSKKTDAPFHIQISRTENYRDTVKGE